VLRLSSGRGPRRHVEVVKVRGNLVTNDGAIAVNWALDGHGILLRAEWDVARHLRNGRLVEVLANLRTAGGRTSSRSIRNVTSIRPSACVRRVSRALAATALTLTL